MKIFSLDIVQMLGFSTAVLLVGIFLVKHIKLLQKFCIPASVVGGLLFAIVNLIGHQTGLFGFDFDMTLKTFFMTCFFATIGFGADLRILKSGGIAVAGFLGINVVLVTLQNILGISISMLFGENPLLGIATSSVAMVGGHGTASSYGPILEAAGLEGGTTYAVAAATFGLIAGSLLGGPTARRLINKNKLKLPTDPVNQKAEEEEAEHQDMIRSSNLLTAFFQIAIAVGLGSLVSMGLKTLLPKVTFPDYIGAMLVAVVMRNIFTEKTPVPTRHKEISALGSIFLSVFLVQALMELELWQLAKLAGPLIVILVAQTLLMYLWATYVTYNTMGRDYDAAVLAAGNCGFGLGATPNAMANMNAVVEKYGPSPKAFFILPIVGSLFIDVLNTGIVTAFINLIQKFLL